MIATRIEISFNNYKRTETNVQQFKMDAMNFIFGCDILPSHSGNCKTFMEDSDRGTCIGMCCKMYIAKEKESNQEQSSIQSRLQNKHIFKRLSRQIVDIQ